MRIFIISILVSLSALASEKDVYDFKWLDADKEVYVLQNRKFVKDNRFFLSFGLSKDISETFINTFSGKLSAGYFFTETLGLEVTGSFGGGSTTEEAEAILQQGTVAFFRQINTSFALKALWTPFYTKINTFNKIIYADWVFSLGPAVVNTEDNRNAFTVQDALSAELISESSVGINWSAGIRFYLTKSLSARADIFGYHYAADRFTQDIDTGDVISSSTIFNTYELLVGLNWTF